MTVARGRNWLGLAGLLLVVAGVAGYFVVVLHFGALLPRVRNEAVPNWLLIATGLGLSLLGAARRGRTRGRRLALAIVAADVVLAAWFGWLLYGMTAVPPARGPTLGAPAPDFALVDQEGRTRRLADFRGAPLLLVFYRGHW